MSITGQVLLMLVELAVLLVGAELLVRGASRLAVAVGMSPLVVGLTVVAFGTSSPELAVSVKAGLADQTSVSFGNVIGSNIFNVLVILGISAVIAPLSVSQRLVRMDVPLIIAICLLVYLLARDGTIGRTDGLVLLALLVGYIAFAIHQSRRESRIVAAEYNEEFGLETEAPNGFQFYVVHAAMMLVGLGLLIFGSDRLVESAVGLARALGVSELIIGLTVVSFGTASPELVTSLVASIRGERDIAVGNVIGSFLFNLLAVLGTLSVVAASGVPVTRGILTFDLPVMTAVAIACLPVFFIGYRISRWEGGLFVAYYAAYVIYMALRANLHPALPAYRTAMLAFAIPLTCLTLLALAMRSLHAASRGAAQAGPPAPGS